MTMHVRASDVTAVRGVGMPRGSARPATGRAVGRQPATEDGHRDQDNDSLMALGLAIVASAILTGLLWTVL